MRHKVPFSVLGIESTPDYPDAYGTEAPWVFEPRTMRVVSVHPRTGMRPAGDPFPTVCRLPATYTPQLVDGYLIAAAPDLLEALEGLTKGFDGVAYSAWTSEMHAAVAAIAKAKGERQ